ncbi:MAG: hypothetical protein L3J24_14390 [Xanthomonadales bacterium]|nr:hypothetical protein [Xanthomonadales bacterium]
MKKHPSAIEQLLLLATFQKEIIVIHKMITANPKDDTEAKFAMYRILVRTVHICMESLLVFMKTEILKSYDQNEISICEKDLQKLLNKKPSKDGKRLVPVKLKFIQNARLVIRLYAEVKAGPSSQSSISVKVPPQAGQWSILRNRITHPKTLDDFRIRPLDVKVAVVMMGWYLNLYDWIASIEKKQAIRFEKERSATLAEMMSANNGGDLSPEDLDKFKARILKTYE